MNTPIIDIKGITRDFQLGNETVYVLKGIDLLINKKPRVKKLILKADQILLETKGLINFFQSVFNIFSIVFIHLHWIPRII